MRISRELIEETGRPQGLFLRWLGQVQVLEKINSFDVVMK